MRGYDMELKKHFITTNRPYREGTVEVLQQRLNTQGIRKATLAITALGLYEAELGGKKVGDALFTPGFTYYPTHLYYQTYDVTDLLTGEDTLTVYLCKNIFPVPFVQISCSLVSCTLL